MIIRLLLTASLSVVLLAAACSGGEAPMATAPNVPISAEALAHFEAGFELQEKGRLELAIAKYDEAIRLEPQFAPFYTNRGSAYDGLGDYERAIQNYDEAIRLDPQDYLAYNNRGLA